MCVLEGERPLVLKRSCICVDWFEGGKRMLFLYVFG